VDNLDRLLEANRAVERALWSVGHGGDRDVYDRLGSHAERLARKVARADAAMMETPGVLSPEVLNDLRDSALDRLGARDHESVLKLARSLGRIATGRRLLGRVSR